MKKLIEKIYGFGFEQLKCIKNAYHFAYISLKLVELMPLQVLALRIFYNKFSENFFIKYIYNISEIFMLVFGKDIIASYILLIIPLLLFLLDTTLIYQISTGRLNNDYNYWFQIFIGIY